MLQFSTYEAILHCPHCGWGYTHHHRVDAYFRESEDADHGVHVIAAERITDLVQVTSDQAGNPSSRRDGLRVRLTCESCDRPFDLTISQHKGQTFIAIRTDEAQERTSPALPLRGAETKAS